MSWRWLWVSLLGLGVMASAIGVAYIRHQHRVAFAQLSALERSRDELNVEFDRLQIQIATLADTGRIERRAVEQLGMRYPDTVDIVLVRP